jgi:hypothetical protein
MQGIEKEREIIIGDKRRLVKEQLIEGCRRVILRHTKTAMLTILAAAGKEVLIHKPSNLALRM